MTPGGVAQAVWLLVILVSSNQSIIDTAVTDPAVANTAIIDVAYRSSSC